MIKIICVGKLKEKYLIEGVNDYLTRLRKYHKVELNNDYLSCQNKCGYFEQNL